MAGTNQTYYRYLNFGEEMPDAIIVGGTSLILRLKHGQAWEVGVAS